MYQAIKMQLHDFGVTGPNQLSAQNLNASGSNAAIAGAEAQYHEAIRLIALVPLAGAY